MFIKTKIDLIYTTCIQHQELYLEVSNFSTPNNYLSSQYGDDHMVFEDKNCDERGQLF